jgi:large subunit ribosomal protein L32
MAVPKRRTSLSRKRKRRSHDAISPVAAHSCSNCGTLRRPHRVCESCGFYDSKQVAAAKED